MSVSVSVVIPTYNEAQGIKNLVQYLLQTSDATVLEIIVSDGGSTDETKKLANDAGAKVIQSPKKGRAAQMNAGAAVASGDILYFLHADTFPPESFLNFILQGFDENYGAGCFRLRFDDNNWFLRLNAWFTRFDIDSIRFGDQSLFISKKIFDQIGGFREDHIVLEDQEIIKRIKNVTRFKIVPATVTTSAQKYRENGFYRLQFTFLMIWLLYYAGVSQQKLVMAYNRIIKKSKLKSAG